MVYQALTPPLLPIYNPEATKTFEEGMKLSTPANGISPESQKILDNIKANQRDSEASGTSQAIALAGRRGIAGSSIEQFGVQNAISEAAKTGQNAESAVLLANEERNNALKNLQAQAMFNRSIYGDKAAFDNYQLQLQQILGQQGIDIARENIDVSRKIAEDQARNNLFSAGISAFVPSILNGFGGGGGGGGMGGGLSSLFGGPSTALGRFFSGGGAATGAGPGGIPLASAGGGGNPFMAGGFGGLMGGAGLGFLGSSLGRQTFGGGNDVGGIAGGGLGYMFGGPIGAGVGSFLGVGAQRLGENIYSGSQGALGNTAASFIKPFVDPVGAVKSVSNAVKKVFPF